MAKIRKTVDCWRFYGNYGCGWELECIEFTRTEMKENRKAYEENSPGALKIVKGRMKKSELSEHDITLIEDKLKVEREARLAKYRTKLSPNASETSIQA